MRSFTPCILSLLTATTATLAIRSADTNAISLSEATFYDFMEEHPLVLANFYASWCRHSKVLTPKFEAAAAELKIDNIPLVNVDCTQNEGLCNDLMIGAYPTLKVFRGPESHEPYNGGRETESIISYMIDESIPEVGGFYYQSYD